MTRTETAQATTLDALEDRYEIIGELGRRHDGRTFIARAREDGTDVLVTVFTRPEGDEGNALSHLASDANRLARSAHPNLVPVHEAQWIDNDTLAVVTDRVRHPTLEELLIRRSEAFSCPRVATLLRDINGVLEWARDEKIVHRHIDASNVHVEPGSDRVFLTFAPRALPLAEMPGPEDDARTIAMLARAMLTRSVADPERDKAPLGELRPGLPDRLIEQTEALLHPRGEGRTPDVSEYIAIVAMADNLKRAEMECAETTQKLLEEERLAREQIDERRQATERAAAEQARLFQLEREEFAKEREGILAELQKQREELERQRAALARERAEHEQDCDRLTAEREEHRRWAAEVEKAFVAHRASLEQEIRAAEQRFAQECSEIDTERAARRERDKEIVVPVSLPRRPRPRRGTPRWLRRVSHAWADARARLPKPHWNRKWNVPAAAVALLLLIVLSAVAITRGRDGGDRVASAAATSAQFTDSAAGRVESAAPGRTMDSSGLPVDFVNSVRRRREAGVPADFVAGVRARADSAVRGTYSEGEDGMIVYTPPPATRRNPPVERTPSNRPASAPQMTTPYAAPATPSITTPAPRPASVDTSAPVPIIINPPVMPAPSPILPDSMARPRPDTLPSLDMGAARSGSSLHGG